MKQPVEGVKETNRNLAALGKKYGEAVVQAAIAAGQIVRADAIKSIQEESAGNTVIRTRAGGGKYEHTASKPGDAPNTDTGRLVQSVQVEIKPKEVYVGSSLEYAGFLEFGTRKMSARPWLFPALEMNRKRIYDEFKLKVDTVTRIHGDKT